MTRHWCQITEVSSVAGKIVVSALLFAIRAACGDPHPFQFAGRSGVSSSLLAACLYSVLSVRKSQGLETFVGLVDVKGAFDNLWKPALWFCYCARGLRGRFLKFCVDLFHSSSTRVTVDGVLSELIVVLAGAQQGCPPSTDFFVTVFNCLLRITYEFPHCVLCLFLFLDRLYAPCLHALPLGACSAIMSCCYHRWWLELSALLCCWL